MNFDKYYTLETGYPSQKRILELAHHDKVKCTLNDVKAWAASNSKTAVFNRQLVKKFFPIKAEHPFQRLQIDLMDVSNENVVQNANVKYLFVCIDVYTRFLMVVPLNNKKESSCTNAMRDIINLNIIKPYKISQIDSDSESAFLSKSFQKLLKTQNIHHNTVPIGDKRQVGIVERINFTIRSKVRKHMEATNSTKYIDVLPQIVRAYNDTIHSFINQTPRKAITSNPHYDDKVISQTRIANNAGYNQADIKQGDKVRVRLQRDITTRGADKTFSKMVYHVVKVEMGEYTISNGKVYKLYDLMKANDTHTQTEDLVGQTQAINRKSKRIATNIRKEGVEKTNEVVDVNARILRKYKNKPRDLGFMISDY